MAAGAQDRTRPGLLDRPAVQYVLVAMLAAAIVFVQLGQTTLDEHEAMAALAQRGIVRADQWLVQGQVEEPLPEPTRLNRWLIPVNNGRPRLVKTPLPYWVAAGLALLRGQTDVDEFSARLPSAIAAVLCALATLGLGRRLFSPRAALLGALMFVTCVGFQKWGRNARPEMLLCLFVTVAMGCFHAGLTAKSRGRRAAWMLAFWAAMGLANLVKEFFPLLLGLPLAAYLCWRAGEQVVGRAGLPAPLDTPSSRGQACPPYETLAGGAARRRLAAYGIGTVAGVALAIILTTRRPAWWTLLSIDDTAGCIITMGLLVLLPLVWYALVSRPWRQVAGLLPTAVPGALVMLAMFVPWLLYMHHLFRAGDVFSEQVAERAAGTGGWSAAQPWYYLLPLLEMTLPWIAFLPGALAVAWMNRFARHRGELVYLFLWSAGLILLLTLSAGKREHYILPLAPAICLLLGFVAEDVFFNHAWIKPPLARVIALGYGAAGLIAPLVVAALWTISKDPGRWDKLLKSSRLADGLPPPAAWLALLAATIPAGAVMAAVLVLALRRRLAGVPALIAAAMVVLLVSFHLGGRLWDERAVIAQFARDAAGIVPADQPVGSWGDPQAKMVYYFGRNIPNVHWVRDRLTAAPDGQRRWDGWLRDEGHVAWMFGYDAHVAGLRPMGFEPVASRDSGQKKKVHQSGRQTLVPVVLVLLGRPAGYNVGARAPAAGPTQ